MIVGAKREIDDAQAEVVRQIFNWYANGGSPRWIAGELNRRGVPAPGASYKRKKRTTLHGTWSPSVLHGDPKIGTGLLHNELYIGHLIWNRRDWVRDPDTNRKVPRLRPQAEWIEKDLPHLRIIDQALWDRVQTRQQSRPPMRKATPPMNVKYLLSGLLKCGVCGSSFVMAGVHHYACAGYLNRRQCTNRIRVRRELVETKCLDGLRRDLLTPERVTLFVKETTRLWAERQHAHGSQRVVAQMRLAVVEQELANLLTAIKAGLLTATTKAELLTLEAEQTRLRQTVAARQTEVVSLLPRLTERYAAVVNHLSALPSRGLGPMREQIRELVGEIRLVPTANGTLDAHLVGRYEGLLNLAVGGNTVGCGGPQSPTVMDISFETALV